MYQKRFGHENVHITLLADLADNPHTTYQDILNFLNLPPHKPTYKQHNKARTIQHPTLHTWLLHPKSFVMRAAKATLTPTLHTRLASYLSSLPTVKKKQSLPESKRHRLKRRAKPVVERTNRLVEADLLTRWGYQNVTPDTDGPLHTEELPSH